MVRPKSIPIKIKTAIEKLHTAPMGVNALAVHVQPWIHVIDCKCLRFWRVTGAGNQKNHQNACQRMSIKIWIVRMHFKHTIRPIIRVKTREMSLDFWI